jgi:drug/metabolite transporter (DMT)-like permease
MATPMNPTMRLEEWLQLVVLSVLWGGAFFFVGIVVKEVPPFTVVLCRSGLAALALAFYLAFYEEQMAVSPRLWGAFLVMGILNSLLPHSLIVWGQRHIDSGLAAILVSTTPLFSVLLTPVWSGEEDITPARVTGVLLGLGGVVVLIGPEALGGLGRHGLGQLATLGAAASYACAGVYGRRFKGLPPIVAAVGQLTGTTVLVLPLALLMEQPWTLHPSLIAWGALFGLALLSTAVAALIFFRILAVAGATNVMLVNFLVPVSALLLGWLVLGEQLDWTALAGMALIFIGLITIDGRLLSHTARLVGGSRKAARSALPGHKTQ